MQHSAKILIVEDELSIALELEMLIDELGHQLIDIVDNAEAALDIILDKSPDLILMDVGIKGKYSGIEVAEQIKHLPIAILFITSSHTQKMFDRAKSTNFAGYLTKPISKFAVQGAIELAIRLFNKPNSQESYQIGPKQTDTTYPLEHEDIFITRFKSYILTNLDDSDLKIEHIARDMGISRMQLHRKIKALTHDTTSKYILSIRLEKAMELIKKQELYISEIAYKVGFNNPNHFSKVFKEKYGKAPTHILK